MRQESTCANVWSRSNWEKGVEQKVGEEQKGRGREGDGDVGARRRIKVPPDTIRQTSTTLYSVAYLDDSNGNL